MNFETFFLGRENIKNPLVGEMVSAAARISEEGISGNETVSMRYGGRMVITAGGSSIASLTEDDFVEIADYDAVRNVAMAIGNREPSPDTPLHWLIYRRDDINAVISSREQAEEKRKIFDIALEALGNLKKSNCIKLEGYGFISVGKNLKEAVEGIKCL